MVIGIDGNEANVKNKVGSGVYAYNLLEEFSKTRNHQFTVFLKEKPLSDLPKENANFKYRVFGPKKLWTQFALPANLTFGPKINIFFTLGHYGPRFSKISYAITIFDLSYLHFPQMFKKDDLYQLTNWSKYSILKSKHIFTISNSSKEDIVKNYHVNPAKITVTYPGYDQKRFKPQSDSAIQKVKNKYKIRGDYIIFVGTLQPRKNIERLIEAFSLLIQNTKYKIQNTQLVVAGKRGWLYDSIFAKVKELKLEDKVIFTGFVLDEDLPALLSGAKAYVLPSLWEGFGIPVIEAQACGVSVVVSNVSSLPEIVTPPPVIPAPPSVILSPSMSLRSRAERGRSNLRVNSAKNLNTSASAIIVDPNSIDSISSGIGKVLTDEKLRQGLIKKGFANTKRFSWQTCANQTLQVLSKLAENTVP